MSDRIDGPYNSVPPRSAQDSEDGLEPASPRAGPAEPDSSAESETLPQRVEQARPVGAGRPGQAQLGFLADVPLRVEIRLGGAQLPIGELLELAPGSVVALERRAEDPVEVVAGGRVIARGEMVVVDDRLGVRITELCEPSGEARE
jgi:flagellar motor switch protein FliN/FliY